MCRGHSLLYCKTYLVFAHPYERKLAVFYRKGIFYFHSCGDITPFLDTIATIPGLRRVHISPATDFKKAISTLGRRFVFQKRMDPFSDLESCDIKTMELKIREVVKVGRDTSMELDPGPIQDVSLEKIKAWVKVAIRTALITSGKWCTWDWDTQRQL